MKSLCFIIYDHPQAWTITHVDDEQQRWLNILINHVNSSQITDVVPHGVLHHGLFSFQAFRKFMQNAGYSNAVASTDIFYNAKVEA